MESKNWIAIRNLEPPEPYKFYVSGDVKTNNRKIRPKLVYKTPQGINPNMLLLDRIGVEGEESSDGNDFITVRYEEPYDDSSIKYTEVSIFYNDDLIAQITVEEVH